MTATQHDDGGVSEPSGDTGSRGKRAVFRVPGTALVGTLMLFLGIFPIAGTVPYLLPLLIVPLVLAVWIMRTRTVATYDRLTVTTLSGTRQLPWDCLKGFTITPKSKIVAVLTDDTTVTLPSVRTRHLPVLSLVSEGRIPDPSGVLDKPEDETTDPAGATESTDTAEATGKAADGTGARSAEAGTRDEADSAS